MRANRAHTLGTIVENLDQGVAIFDSNRCLTSYNSLYGNFYQFPDGFLKPGLLYDDIIRYLVERGEYGDVDYDDFLAWRLI